MEPVNENKEVVEEVKEETVAEQPVEEAVEQPVAETPAEPPKADMARKIKLGIVAVGGVFILLAIVYMAAIAGGRNKNIEGDKEPVVVVVPVEEPEITPEPSPEPTVEIEEEIVEEETPEESMLAVVQGNARYDECIYGDGGAVVVRKGDKYGAINYRGEEIVPLKYEEIEQIPTKEGMFVLSTSKVENVAEEKDGTTYSYEEETVTYTLFDNTGKELYKGNDKVIASYDNYILGVEDKEDERKSRVEYHKIGTKDKPYLTLYVNDQFSLNGFMDGMTTVMGFTTVPTEDQDTNPTKLVCGTMDEKGKVAWFNKAPGVEDFTKEVAQWKKDNKVIQKKIQTTNKKKETAKQKNDTSDKKKKKEALEKLVQYDADGNPIVTSEELLAELVEEFGVGSAEELFALLYADSDELEDEALEDEKSSVVEEDEILEEDETDSQLSEEDGTDKLTDEEDEEDDSSNGPVFHMDEILSAPVGGYFIYKDLYDVDDPYSIYTDKGAWYADIDTAYLEADAKKGFKVGNFNNGAVELKGYVMDGEVYYNFGSYMVLHVGDKDVLIDISKAKGMTTESITDKIVVAIYDEINLNAANAWMYKDGNKAGYLDLKGQAIKVTYDDATSFVDGYALVVKDGKAFIINEQFEEVEEVCDAKSVDLAGDIMSVKNANGVRRFMLKETRENPRGNEIPDATAKEEDPKATTDNKNNKKNKK